MNHWFTSKMYGWGWQPVTWQGWLISFLWFFSNVWYAIRVDSMSHSMSDTLLNFAPFFVLSTLVFFAIAWKRGEWPTWQWAGHTVPASVVWRKFFILLVFIVVAQAAGVIGAFFTIDAIPAWYAALSKPYFSPPNWVFGPVWTMLYILMGVAAFFAWDVRYEKTHAKRALKWYWFQLFLNALWTPIFFGAQNIGLALIIIIALWFSIIFMIREFAGFNKWLALLLLPYLGWVSFATLLNYSLWMLN